MRNLVAAILASAASLAMVAPAHAAEAAAAAPAVHYTSGETQIGTMLDDPAAKAVLEKYIGELMQNPQFDQARSMTLKSIAGYLPQLLTDEKLAQIDADLAKIPGK